LICQNSRCRFVVAFDKKEKGLEQTSAALSHCPECGSPWSSACPFCGLPFVVTWMAQRPHSSCCHHRLQPEAA
jgi:hypothetical protein